MRKQTSHILKGDVPDCFYRWGMTCAMSEFFIIPGMSCQDLKKALEDQGDFEAVERLLDGRDPKDLAYVGLAVVAMGWNWAVYLAQEALMSIMCEAGEVIQKEFSLDQNPFQERYLLVEGGPAPEVRPGAHLPFSYIDDFGLMAFGLPEAMDQARGRKYMDTIKSTLAKYHIPVHKEEDGEVSKTIGVEVGGSPPRVQPDEERRFEVIQNLWLIGRNGRATCEEVDYAVAVATWLFMMGRGGLSVFDVAYAWIRIHRGSTEVLLVPKEVRREVLAAAALLLLLGQDLTMEWNSKVLMFDASTEGGGIIQTSSNVAELKAEARWAVRGNWITRTEPITNFFDHYRPGEEEPERVVVEIPRGIDLVRVYVFLHMFSGLQRDKDLEWYLIRKGAAAGFRVIVESMDLAYGEQYDLADQQKVKAMQSKAAKYSGAHNGSPCSTWSRVRYRPGGPPPLRSREHPFGLPSNSNTQQKHCNVHNMLLRNSWSILLAISLAGGLVSNEHPADPMRHPYPSTWVLPFVKRIERLAGMFRVIFPQCLWGLASKKMTCISANLDGLQELDVYGDSSCRHQFHEILMGRDEEGRFKTRRAQTYPPQLCEKLAELYVRNWVAGKGNPEWVSPAVLAQQEEEEEEEGALGEKVPVPEVSRDWDPIDRWSEVSRWTWMAEEHNNVLEGRAGVVSAKILSSDPSNWNRRSLLISDSQVVIGVFSKGRSAKKLMNHLARKIASISFGCNIRMYWRYIRTWRNHSDGPSRGYPLGVAPKGESTSGGPTSGVLKGLPDFFYRTSG